MSQLKDNRQLEQSDIVANCLMNRLRDLTGSNGYSVEIGMDPLDLLRRRLEQKKGPVRWLDFCCGSAKALIQARQWIHDNHLCGQVEIVGVDLVDMFFRSDEPFRCDCLELIASSIFEFQPVLKFDLITSVHGLHYLGDKIAALEYVNNWLAENGQFYGNLDLANLNIANSKYVEPVLREFKIRQIQYSKRRKVIRFVKTQWSPFPFSYLGADDTAGPNYTGQPAVNSHYESS